MHHVSTNRPKVQRRVDAVTYLYRQTSRERRVLVSWREDCEGEGGFRWSGHDDDVVQRPMRELGACWCRRK